MTSVDKQVEAIMLGCEYGDTRIQQEMEAEFRERLVESEKTGRPLRVYCGYDPSAPDLHLGHSITLRKLRLFQDFGHHVIFLAGTFTARVGDTSDKTGSRPQKTADEVDAAGRTYAEQCFKILDSEKTEVACNADWLAGLNLQDVVNLASNFTVQQFLARDNYKKRIEAGNPVGLHEFMYALMQGYDAVHLRTDVQIGATDQLFNILAGRKLQSAFGQKPLVCITYPILVGTDGKQRMSKSKGNYIGLSDAPEDQFGKIMSLSDETMADYIELVTRWEPEEIRSTLAGLREGELHPMQVKKRLAFEVVCMYHGDEAAGAAQAHFERVHQQRGVPEKIEERQIREPVRLVDLMYEARLVRSKSEARRLIAGGGVKLDGDRVTEIDRVLEPGEMLLQVGKRGFLRIVAAGN